MIARRAALVLAPLLFPAATAAQEKGIALDLAVGYQDLTSASDSAKAVFDGSSGGVTFGGGLRYGLGSSLFVGAFVRYFSKDGERVFVASPGGEVFRLGHPLSLRLIPFQGTVGWRFGSGSLRPYAGGGIGFTSYHEESTVGGVTESASETKFSAHLLGGLEFGIAIPGTVGGAVRMNAGAHGGEMREVLEWADVTRLARGGAVERWPADALGMAYRHTELPPDAVVVAARLRLRRMPAESLAASMREMRRWRRGHQPLADPTCGSVFANPPGDSAGRLIEAAGLKGHRVGAARVSEKHANFIVGGHGATAADVRGVICDVRRAVEERFGVCLRTEVVLAGFDAEGAP